MSTQTYDFLIGADPEFNCTDDAGYSISSEDFFPNSLNGPVGVDGGGHVYEVRPDASEEPLEVVGNIQTCLKQQSFFKPKFYKLHWKAGSYHNGHPLGGHIHFGIKKHTISRKSAIEFLDQYLGSISLLIENRQEGLNRRIGGDYGMKGDYRGQPHGFEYRTISSWLVSPYVAAAILCLAKTIMFESLNNNKFKWNNFVDRTYFDHMKTPEIKIKFPKIWHDITKMKLYQKYKLYIDLIYFLVDHNLTWYPTTSMKNAWGIVDLSQNTDKINLDIIWLKYRNQYKKQEND